MIMFDSAYKPKSLNNWELPKWHSTRPRQREGSTIAIANDRGHLLDRNLLKTQDNPWAQVPDKIDKNFVEKYNSILNKKKYLSICDNTNNENVDITKSGMPNPTICQPTEEKFKFEPSRQKLFDSWTKNDSSDLEYVPGDFTSFKNQHPTRDFLLEDKYKRSNNIETNFVLDKNCKRQDHECKLIECETPSPNVKSLLSQPSALVTSNLSPTIQDFAISNKNNSDDCLNINDTKTLKMFGSHSITEKPNERCPSPVEPAYANFELAKRMHSNNLDHQPLPDCVADLAFRKMQITGANPGLALDIEPIATGIGLKTHNAGPTHCTKMKVYRPKTSGVVPKAISDNMARSSSAALVGKKMNAMDLAICWDYKPSYESPRAKHIDGSSNSAGPSVFTYVQTPRDDAMVTTGNSTGVFTNTLGDIGFFDKDVLRHKNDFAGRKLSTDDFTNDIPSTLTRALSVSRDHSTCQALADSRFSKQYKSTPDMLADKKYKALREKYLGPVCEYPSTSIGKGCKRESFIRRARSRLCHKITPESNCCSSSCPSKRTTCKAAFLAGVPRRNVTGNFISGNDRDLNNSQRVLVVPRPRNPYAKRNYDIDTLVPPFQSYAGGAGEGGYPEHWRLASVYQHSYKPLEYRKKSLLQTVYK